MAEKFELGSYLKGIVPESDTTEEQIEYIDIGLIDGDENNFYELSDVEALAANIETVGLQQPLRVRTFEADPLRVQIISGHRRKAALDKLVQDGNEKFRRVPVIRDQVSGSAALQELKLIFANSDTRKITSADLSKQAQRVEALLVQLREEGYDFPGRMRDHVAEACKVSRTKLANLKVIREKLIPEAKQAWEKGDLAEDAALALARLPEQQQEMIVVCNKERHNGKLQYLYTSEIERRKETIDNIRNIGCTLTGGKCANFDGKWAKITGKDYYYGSCGRICCSVCPDLGTCKHACPGLASEIHAAKEQKKQEKAKEKADKAEKERPDLELLQAFWTRFHAAREAAGCNIESLFGPECWNLRWAESYIREFKKLDGGAVTAQSKTPFGRTVWLDDAKQLLQMASYLDCSLDYLFCRTDEPNPAQVKMEVAADKPTWRTDAPPEGTNVLGKFELPGSPKRLIRTAYYLNGTYYFSQANLSPIDTPCLGWTPIPED